MGYEYKWNENHINHKKMEKIIDALFSAPASDGDKLPWPSASDLNTRLRRVITGYQRNYKKEQIKIQQKAKVVMTIISRGIGHKLIC